MPPAAPDSQLDHKAFAAGLDPALRIRLFSPSNRRGLQRLAVHWGLIVLGGAAIAGSGRYWPLLMPFQGFLLIFTFTCMHECTHKTAFRSPWINEFTGRICGILVGIPFLWFRYFHLAHHRYTNDPRRDPELLAAQKPRTALQYVIHLSGLKIWAGNVVQLIRMAIWGPKDSFVPRGQRRKMWLEINITVLFYILISVFSLFYSTILIKAWIIPVFIAQPMLRVFLLAEHGHCRAVADMFENSRTTFTSSVLRYFTWNMPFHAEHHALPQVPFYNLPTLHRYTKPHLKTTAHGYFQFHKNYVTRF